MVKDVRHFEVDLGDADMATMWSVVLAVEEAAMEAARQFGLDVIAETQVDHTTGELIRDTASEARSSIERYGFVIERVNLFIRQKDWMPPLPDGERLPSVPVSWVDLTRDSRNSLIVRVTRGTEVEVNGVFSMLQAAAQAALAVPVTKASVAVVTPPPVPRGRRVLSAVTTHPLIVSIVGLVVAAVLSWLGYWLGFSK